MVFPIKTLGSSLQCVVFRDDAFLLFFPENTEFLKEITKEAIPATINRLPKVVRHQMTHLSYCTKSPDWDLKDSRRQQCQDYWKTVVTVSKDAITWYTAKSAATRGTGEYCVHAARIMDKNSILENIWLWRWSMAASVRDEPFSSLD